MAVNVATNINWYELSGIILQLDCFKRLLGVVIMVRVLLVPMIVGSNEDMQNMVGWMKVPVHSLAVKLKTLTWR